MKIFLNNLQFTSLFIINTANLPVYRLSSSGNHNRWLTNMGIHLRFIIGVLYLTLLNSNVSSVTVRETWTIQSLRVKRQEGYVYDKPSVSFDLPSRSTSEVTQTFSTPSVERSQTSAIDRPQSQYMYYAYPVPSGGGGDTVNIGYSSTSTSANTASVATGAGASGGGGGYNYEPSNAGISTTESNIGSGQSGYSSGASTVAPSTISSSGGGYNYESQTSTSSGPTGYNFNSPGPIVRSNQGGVTVTTTNAPQYLPPTGGSAASGAGKNFNIPSGTGPTVPTPIPISTNPSTPDAAYLPPSPSPNPVPQPQPAPSPAPNPAPQPPSGYLPPASSTPGARAQTTVSTPASTYLPPVF